MFVCLMPLGAVKDSLVGVYTMAQYLFFFLHDKFKRDAGYMKVFGLSTPCTSVGTILFRWFSQYLHVPLVSFLFVTPFTSRAFCRGD